MQITHHVPVRGLGWPRLAGAAVALLTAATAAAGPHDVYERHRTAVVAVTYYVETNFMREIREVEGRDIGVVVAPDLILVNGSVVTSSATGAQPHSFRAHFAGGATLVAEYSGRDEFANVAFLRLSDPLPAGVEPIEFAAKVSPKVGEDVMAIGLLPDNLDPMTRIHQGRVIARVERPKPFLVTDIVLDDVLGGPVFNRSGRAIGVLSELGGAGPSFATSFGGAEEGGYALIVDAETLRPLIADPPQRGETRRAWLGITLQALTDDMAQYWGLGDRGGIIVNSVVAGSPAAAAGLQVGDIVVSMNGQPIPVDQEDHVPIFVEQVGSAPVGSKQHFEVVRGSEHLQLDVELAAAPKSRLEAEQYHNDDFELTVRELVFTDYRAFDLDPDFKGVLVSKVEEGGWSGVGGLRTGDIIQRVEDHDVASPGDVKKVLEDASAKKTRKLVFFVQRQGRTQFITVQPNWNNGS